MTCTMDCFYPGIMRFCKEDMPFHREHSFVSIHVRDRFRKVRQGDGEVRLETVKKLIVATAEIHKIKVKC